jgi:hypothetical protein
MASTKRHPPAEKLQKPSETISITLKNRSKLAGVVVAVSGARPVAPRHDRPEIMKLMGSAGVGSAPSDTSALYDEHQTSPTC